MALAANSVEGKAEGFLKRIEALNIEAESAKGSYMAECRERREDIKSIYTEARDAGVPPKALKGLVKKRDLERKAAAIPDGFDIDETSAYQALIAALGPLGQAAVDRAKSTPTNGAARADETHLAHVGQGQQ